MKFYTITEKHKSARWKFLLGGLALFIIDALGNVRTNPTGVVQALFTGPVIGYMVWWAWAKTKNYSAASSIDQKTPHQKFESGTLVVLSIAALAGIGISASIAIPAYQDYTTRARIAEVATFGSKATESITAYYAQHQSVTSNLVEAGFSEALPSSVKSVTVNNENGVVTLTMATSPIAGKTLLFVPSLDENKKLSWQCMSTDIEDKLLPKLCRQANQQQRLPSFR